MRQLDDGERRSHSDRRFDGISTLAPDSKTRLTGQMMRWGDHPSKGARCVQHVNLAS
jgi:hypothetical protein